MFILQLVLDKAFSPSCPTVLYKSDDDRMVFPRIDFNPVDHKYIYIALQNQVRLNNLLQNLIRQCYISLLNLIYMFVCWLHYYNICHTNAFVPAGWPSIVRTGRGVDEGSAQTECGSVLICER